MSPTTTTRPRRTQHNKTRHTQQTHCFSPPDLRPSVHLALLGLGAQVLGAALAHVSPEQRREEGAQAARSMHLTRSETEMRQDRDNKTQTAHRIRAQIESAQQSVMIECARRRPGSGGACRWTCASPSPAARLPVRAVLRVCVSKAVKRGPRQRQHHCDDDKPRQDNPYTNTQHKQDNRQGARTGFLALLDEVLELLVVGGRELLRRHAALALEELRCVQRLRPTRERMRERSEKREARSEKREARSEGSSAPRDGTDAEEET
eukprot:893751-Rhodomonas_salina.2